MKLCKVGIGAIVLMLLITIMAQAGPVIKETDVLTWNGSAWARLAKGAIYGAGAAAGAVTQTTNTGVGFTVSRDKASGNTDAPLMYVINDNAGDDQAAVYVRQDGAGDILRLYGGSGNLRWSMTTGGSSLLTTAATTGFAAHIDGSTITTGDVLKLTVNDTPLAGGKYITCVDDGSTVDFSVGEAGAVVVGGTLAVGGATTQTGEWQAGGGYGSTGCTIATSGNVSTNGALVVDGTATVSGILYAGVKPIVNLTDQTLTISSAHYGRYVACSYAGTTTVTLPDPSAGTVGVEFYIVQTVDQTLTIVGGSTANNNQIICEGVATSDNVSYSTGGAKIGAMARVVGISATKWLITNASECALTPEAAD